MPLQELNFHVHLFGFQGRSAKRPSSQTGVSVFNRCLCQFTIAADNRPLSSTGRHQRGVAGSEHQGWIECTMADWMITQPRSACASTGGGHTVGRCEHSTIDLRKLADLSSPILLQYCAMGKTIPSGRIEFFRADGMGSRVKYFEVERANVLIGEVAQDLCQCGVDWPLDARHCARDRSC